MKVSIDKRKVRDSVKWALTVHQDGKRRRKFFNTYAEANQFDANEWINGFKKMEPCGDETTLATALQIYLQEYSRKNTNEAKPRQKGLEGTQYRIERFLEFVGDVKVSDVTVQDFKDYIMSGKWSDDTRRGYGGAVTIFMAWCAKQGYGQNPLDWYHKTNPDLAWEKQKKFHSLPGICTPEETKALLMAMPEKYRPAMAIMFFTGIRPEMEMQMLRYSDIKYGKNIRLQAERTKTGRERYIKPPENLWRWVPRGKGHIMESYGAFNQCRRRASRRAFGFKEGTAYKEGFNYPSNGARHSFGSYGFWISFEWALDTMGHMSSEIFLRNYKNSRVDKEEAEEYFSI